MGSLCPGFNKRPGGGLVGRMSCANSLINVQDWRLILLSHKVEHWLGLSPMLQPHKTNMPHPKNSQRQGF